MHRLVNLIKRQQGDTIIEVMVALAIMGAVVVGAYTTASRATRGAQMSQERIQAVKVAEHQMEVLRDYAGRFTDADINPTDPSLSKNVFINETFCINPQTNRRIVWPSGDPSAVSMFDDVLGPGGDYPAECITDDGRYHISIKRNGNIFHGIVRWDRIGGGRDEVNLKAKLYKPVDF